MNDCKQCPLNHPEILDGIAAMLQQSRLMFTGEAKQLARALARVDEKLSADERADHAADLEKTRKRAEAAEHCATLCETALSRLASRVDVDEPGDPEPPRGEG